MSVKKQVAVEETVNESASLFSRLYHQNDKTVKEQDYPLTERSLQRKLQSAYDDGISKIASYTQKINAERAKLGGMNLQTILELRQQIENTQLAMEYTNQESVELFGEELKK